MVVNTYVSDNHVVEGTETFNVLIHYSDSDDRYPESFVSIFIIDNDCKLSICTLL